MAKRKTKRKITKKKVAKKNKTTPKKTARKPLKEHSKKASKKNNASSKKSHPEKKLNGELIPTHSYEVIYRKNPDETISVMNLEVNDSYFTLDGIAAEIWLEMDGKKTIENIIAPLIKKHNPPIKRFKSDTANLLDELKKNDLIEINNS